MAPGSAKPRLDFIRDAKATGGANVLVNVLQISVRKNNAASDTLNRFGNESSDLPWRCEIDQVFHVVRIFLSSIGVVASPQATVRIGRDRMMNAKAVRHVEFPCPVCGQTHRQGAAAMVCVTQRDDVVITGVSTR